ncbi:hypothetical protein MWU58_12860 [Flavobacteriaceae bacterium S0825]|uniref:hypothetical protein n=1 Tax=Gaetbulibacter sp. S0825 TaxID=2720084 RepID=UPI0014311D38|nr:hypothetical protein [Gaetbulibacter sp. S0825]MCK0110191.1 hypothetical protein [Flavobacteriaceae bacterium S0825]NIX65820.1 hypothetical protein [Gaetbulibacter sp. S0825]
MEQDIRKLFKTEMEADKKLPVSHRDEFQKKLKDYKLKRSQKNSIQSVFKYAAAIILFVALGYVSLNKLTQESIIKESALELQIKEVEQQYLENIEKEWQSFKALTDDKKLVERYKKELDDLNRDYQFISEQFKADSNNILIIESIVKNLQTRLRLLKDIQEHIKLLNQKNGYYETIQI